MTNRFRLIQSYLNQTQLILIFLNRFSGRIRVGRRWYVSDCKSDLSWNFSSYRSPALKIVENLSRLPPVESNFVTTWLRDISSWPNELRDKMHFVTSVCVKRYVDRHEVILRSREVTDCPEHALVTNLFVANIRRLPKVNLPRSYTSPLLTSLDDVIQK